MGRFLVTSWGEPGRTPGRNVAQRRLVRGFGGWKPPNEQFLKLSSHLATPSHCASESHLQDVVLDLHGQRVEGDRQRNILRALQKS